MLGRPTDDQMSILAFAQLKGGTGKSTTAIHMAVALQAHGLEVAVVDTDPQGSTAMWSEARGDASPCVVALSPRHLQQWLAENEHQFDIVLVDTPAHDSDTLADVARFSDLVVILTQPTWLAIAVAIRLRTAFIDHNVNYCILLSQTPPRLTSRLRGWIANYHQLGTVVDAQLAYRMAYQDAIALGLGVTEFEPHGHAANEVRRAAAWMLRRLEMIP
jgi:chromosome partitioning protein